MTKPIVLLLATLILLATDSILLAQSDTDRAAQEQTIERSLEDAAHARFSPPRLRHPERQRGLLFQRDKLQFQQSSSGNLHSYSLNDSVHEVLVARYNGPANSDDRATALVVDASGNFYVTGWSVDTTNQGSDYATIKYNRLGVPQWIARYHGAANSWDRAQALVVDPSGNVYVTGSSIDSVWPPNNADYTTIKYNSSGVTQWVARYNGPGNSYDGASALAVDASGNVYVTGMSTGVTGTDYATIKYGSTGVQQWVARYSDPINVQDVALALAIDSMGNVYVTGESYTLSSSADYVTLKYNRLGVQQWLARYNGPRNDADYARALAVDASGNVYVTGFSMRANADYDYATIKYDSLGVQQWIARYNGPGNFDNFASAIVLDASSNIYVTGSSYGSGTSYDYATIKYNSSGNEQWVARYNGPENGDDGATALALDATGNIYVTGHSIGTGTSSDYATIKYNSSGVLQWVARYNGPENSDDSPLALCVDSAGGVYVTGYSAGSGTGNDFATIKYAQLPTSVRQPGTRVPEEFALEQNYPNPFNPSTTIAFSLPRASYVTLKVSNTLGQDVVTLLSQELAAGTYETKWDATGIGSGMYFYRLQAGSLAGTKKLILLR